MAQCSEADFTILLTRPREASERFAVTLQEILPTVRIVISPLMEVEFLPFPQLCDDGWAYIFTSRNAVSAARRAGLDGGRAYCVGAATADFARMAGFDICATAPTAAELFDELHENPPMLKLCHLRGEQIAFPLAEKLKQAGTETKEVVVYRQIAQPFDAVVQEILSQDGDVIVPLFSPHSAELFGLAAQGHRARIVYVAISAAAAAKITAETCHLAATPDAEGMKNAVLALFDAADSA